MPYTFATLGPAIDDYVARATHAAVSGGLVPELGTEWADRGRVKTGQNTASAASQRGEVAKDSDPGTAPPPADQYPPRFWPPPTRQSFIDGVRGSKPGETLSVIETAPHSAPREALDHVVEPSIRATRGRWKNVGERAAANVRPRRVN